MVLADLGRKLQGALSDLQRAPVVDEAVLDAILKEICTALLESDVNVKLVSNLRTKVKTKVVPSLGSDGNKKNIIQKAVYDELVALVDPEKDALASTAAGAAGPSQPWKPTKGKQNVIMFVGLQGSGKTTSCTKLAVHYQKRGFRSALVCADTFRAGAFDQLKQNATKAKIPFFGSYTETDPVSISAQGVQKFRQEKFEVIIVDTSGRHRQETELFQEMKEISSAVKPALTILVLDGAIGQAAESQSRAFKEAAGFAGIIVTKMDGHARGGGAISAVAATRTPIMFIGTGEHLHDLERFSPGPFISKMLGMGDMQGLMEHVQEVQARDPKKQQDMLKRIGEGGAFSIRDLREQMNTVMSMGPLSKVAGMIPGMAEVFSQGGSEQDMSSQIKKIMFITDSMTAVELDSDGSLFYDTPPPSADKENTGKKAKKPADYSPREPNKRVLRVARGCGVTVDQVEEILVQHRMFGGVVKSMGGLANMAKMKQGGAGARGQPRPDPSQMAAMQKMLPPEFQGQGGMAALREQAKQMGLLGANGQPDMSKLSGMMGGMNPFASMMGGK